MGQRDTVCRSNALLAESMCPATLSETETTTRARPTSEYSLSRASYESIQVTILSPETTT